MASERRLLEGLQQAVLLTGSTICNWPTHVSHGTRTLLLDIGPLRHNCSARAAANRGTREDRISVSQTHEYGRGKRQVVAARGNTPCRTRRMLKLAREPIRVIAT